VGIPEKWAGRKELPADIHKKIWMLGSIFSKYNVSLAYVFGSFLKRPKPNDIDIAVLYNGDLIKLVSELMEFFRTDRIDVIDLRCAPCELAFSIIKNGKLIYKENDAVENSFELKTLKFFRDMETLRRKKLMVLRRKYLDDV
jgi:predicted nucleotidyltransferase